jgi:F-type H+-transporting ATPase subunit gamma
VQTRQLLPAPPPAAAEVDEPEEAPPGAATASSGPSGFTEFEPDSVELLTSLVPRYAEASIFGALLEGAASELTARQRAMAAATENADELIKTLSRVMNRARQDAITTEIMEIVGGAEALRQGADVE